MNRKQVKNEISNLPGVQKTINIKRRDWKLYPLKKNDQ